MAKQKVITWLLGILLMISIAFATPGTDCSTDPSDYIYYNESATPVGSGYFHQFDDCGDCTIDIYTTPTGWSFNGGYEDTYVEYLIFWHNAVSTAFWITTTNGGWDATTISIDSPINMSVYYNNATGWINYTATNGTVTWESDYDNGGAGTAELKFLKETRQGGVPGNSEIYVYEGEVCPAAVVDIFTVTLSNQTPNNITALNLLEQDLFINYSFNSSDALNTSTIRLYYNITGLVEDYIFINGSIEDVGSKTFLVNNSNIFSWELDEHEIYPATYNRDAEDFETLQHQNTTMTLTNFWLKIEYYNVSDSKRFSFFEIMAQNTSATSDNLQVWYCNETYTTGNPVTSDECTDFFNFMPQDYNHTHSVTSSHIIAPMTIQDGKIEDVKVTNTSYILLTTSANDWRYFHIENTSRQSATETTNNNGATWTTQQYEVDAHIHQYDGTDTINYLAGGCDITGQCINSSVTSDVIDVPNFPPTAPVFITPNDLINNTNITIKWNPSVDANNDSITYDVYLDNTDASTLVSNNQVLLNYTTNLTVSDTYYYKVVASDNIAESPSLIQNFTLDIITPECTFTFPQENNLSEVINSSVTFTASCNDNNMLYSFNLSMDDADSQSFNISGIDAISYSFSESFDFTNTSVGSVIEMTYTYCDAHTKEKLTILNDENMLITPTTIYYDNNFFITALDSEVTEINSYMDADKSKYKFDFDYSLKKSQFRFSVSGNKVHHIDSDIYPGWFVVNDIFWVDFDLDENSIVLVEDNIVTVIVDKPTDKLKFKSVGELNCFTEYLTFDIVAAPPPSTSIMPSFLLSIRTPESTAEVLFIGLMFFMWAFFLVMMYSQRLLYWALSEIVMGLLAGFVMLYYFPILGFTFMFISTTAGSLLLAD